MQRKTKRRRQQQQTQRQHTTEKDTTHGVRALVLAFGFSEYREKFISSGKRKDEGERTNERTNGTEQKTAMGQRRQAVGAVRGRLESPVGRGVRPLQQDHQGASGLESILLLGATQSATIRVHVPQSDTNLSYLVGSPLSGWSLEGLQPDLLHHGNLVGRLLNRLLQLF